MLGCAARGAVCPRRVGSRADQRVVRGDQRRGLAGAADDLPAAVGGVVDVHPRRRVGVRREVVVGAAIAVGVGLPRGFGLGRVTAGAGARPRHLARRRGRPACRSPFAGTMVVPPAAVTPGKRRGIDVAGLRGPTRSCTASSGRRRDSRSPPEAATVAIPGNVNVPVFFSQVCSLLAADWAGLARRNGAPAVGDHVGSGGHVRSRVLRHGEIADPVGESLDQFDLAVRAHRRDGIEVERDLRLPAALAVGRR